MTAEDKMSLQLLQLESTDTHDFIKVTITLQHTSCCMFRSSLAHSVTLMKS